MRLKPFVWLALATLFVCVAYSAHAQSAPSAAGFKLPLAVGTGLSGFNTDEGHGHLLGGTLWVDYFPGWVPSILRGLGLEGEARDLNYDRSPSLPKNERQDTVQGGLIYSWPRIDNLRPYAKFSEGYGNADEGSTVRYHDSRTIASGGGGVEFRAVGGLWVRADYEYQSWPNFFKHPATVNPAEPARLGGRLNPQGFTVGAVFHFDRPHAH